MSTKVGEIDLDLILNSESFQKQLDDAVNKALNSVSKKAGGTLTGIFSKLGKTVAAAFAVKKVVAFGSECIQLGSDLAEVQNVVDVTFGSMTSKVDEFAKSAITSVGLSETVAKQYMGQYGSMAKAFGYSVESAYDMSETLTKLTGDVASFYNLSTDEAQTKLKSVFTGETESLKELGVVMTQTALDEFALQKGYGKTTAAMSEQEKVALRLAFVTDRLSDASGDFERTADGWANQTRVLSLRFDALKATLGQGLINALTPAVRLLNELIEQLQKAADAFSEFTASVFGKQDVATATASAAANVASIEASATGAADAIAAAKKSLAGFDKLNVIGSDSSTSSSGTTSGGDTTTSDEAEVAENTTTALKTQNKVVEKLSKAWKNLTTFISATAKVCVSFYNVALKPLVKALGGVLIEAISVLCNLLGGLGTFISKNETLVVTALAAITAGIVAFKTAAVLTSVVQSFQKAQIAISLLTMKIGSANLAQAALNGTMTVGETIVALLTGKMSLAALAQKAMTAAQTALNAAMTANPVGLVVAAIAALIAIFVVLWNKCEGFRNFWINLWDGIKSAFSSVVNWIKENWQSMLLFLINPLAGVFSYCYKHFEGFRNFVDKIVQSVAGIFTGLWNGIKNGFTTAINGLIKLANLWIDGLNLLLTPARAIIAGVAKAFGHDITITDVKIPNIPALKNGGYVEANTPQLAMIGDNTHEGEIVAPESKITEAVVAGLGPIVEVLKQLGATIQALKSGNGQDIVVKCILDGKVVYETVVKQNKAYKRQNGGVSPLNA